MGAAVVGQHIDLPFADILDRGQLQKTAEVGGQVNIRVIPSKMYRLGSHPVQQGHVVRGDEPNIQPL